MDRESLATTRARALFSACSCSFICFRVWICFSWWRFCSETRRDRQTDRDTQTDRPEDKRRTERSRAVWLAWSSRAQRCGGLTGEDRRSGGWCPAGGAGLTGTLAPGARGGATARGTPHQHGGQVWGRGCCPLLDPIPTCSVLDTETQTRTLRGPAVSALRWK